MLAGEFLDKGLHLFTEATWTNVTGDFDMPSVFNFSGFKHQPVNMINTDQMTTDLNGRQVLEANGPRCKDRNQEPVAIMNLCLQRVISTSNS